ncbi:MAG TPA: hypothetical protein VIK86_08110 [Candidatus Paceibacterota bacterium]
MKIDKTYQTVELGDMTTITDENGMPYNTFVQNGETIEVETIDIYSDDSKVFKRLSDDAVLSNHITIGTMDSIDNYIEVDEVKAEDVIEIST